MTDEAKKEYQRAYYVANQDRLRVQHVAYSRTHRAAVLATSRKWCREHAEQYNATSRLAARKRYKSNPARYRTLQRTWRNKNPEMNKKIQLRSDLKGFGMTVAQYDALIALQEGLCAICRKIPSGSRLAVDHDHASGANRGLLCNSCNGGLGLLRDSPALLRAALDYLATYAAGGR